MGWGIVGSGIAPLKVDALRGNTATEHYGLVVLKGLE